METLGFELNHDEIRNVFHVADVNADGVIDIDEFLSVVEGEIGLSSSE
jgi:Ca2+-binding EF-hand superfamily protein